MSTIDMEFVDSDYDDDDVISMEGDSDFDDFNDENTVPIKSTKSKGTLTKVTKKAKGKSSSSSSKSSALKEVSNEIDSKSTGSKKKGAKTVEQIYQKKTQLEHILLRPDTYSKSTIINNTLYRNICGNFSNNISMSFTFSSCPTIQSDLLKELINPCSFLMKNLVESRKKI